jgi:hypothetical protein
MEPIAPFIVPLYLLKPAYARRSAAMRSAVLRQSRWGPDTKQTSDSIPTKMLDVARANGLGRAFLRLTAITRHFEGSVKQPSNKYRNLCSSKRLPEPTADPRLCDSNHI